VILFTTASGAGYGLLTWVAAAALASMGSAAPAIGFWGDGLALVLVTTGLLSSTFHLGHPERAWRALSQWRTSWLSREGIVALVTYAPALALAYGLVSGGWHRTFLGAIAGATLVGALATLWCTGMIYASLPTVRAWSKPHVPFLYIGLALSTGGLLFALLCALLGLPVRAPLIGVLALTGLAWIGKASFWEAIDADPRAWTIEAATGLGDEGKVRMLDPPHTQPNYVMREMGYRVARDHAAELRRATVLALFVAPMALALMVLLGAPLSTLLLGAATVSAAAGVLLERWLFFAEAEHVAMLYYGSDKA
jgi:DMSO reductase anchor subunit